MARRKKSDKKFIIPEQFNFFTFDAIKSAFEHNEISAKQALGQFVKHTTERAKAKEVAQSWTYILKEIFPQVEDEEYADFQYGNAPWQRLTQIKSKDDFIAEYIAPVLDCPLEEAVNLIKKVVDGDDTATQKFQNIVLNTPNKRHRERTHSEETMQKAQLAKELRSQGMTQKAIAQQLDCTQQRVARLLKIDSFTIDTAYNVSGIGCKSHGNASTYTISRLERDGFGELAEKVRNKEMSAKQARIEAGYEDKNGIKLQHTVTEPEDLANYLEKKVNKDFLRELAFILQQRTQDN